MKKSRFGSAFNDQFSKGSFQFGHFKKNLNSSNWQEALITGFSEFNETSPMNPFCKIIFPLGVLAIFSILTFRLFHLQVVEGKANQELADSNRIQVKIIHAPRGVIYDRNGDILAQNEPGFRLLEKKDNGEVKTIYISREESLKMEVNNDPRLQDLEVDNNRIYSLGEKAALYHFF